jgi:hypothetical protein
VAGAAAAVAGAAAAVAVAAGAGKRKTTNIKGHDTSSFFLLDIDNLFKRNHDVTKH